MITINFIFSIGFRCNSPDFLGVNKIRNIAGPFDYLFVNIETAFEIISNNFDYFFNDIILINKNKNIIKNHYSTKPIDKKIIDFVNNKYIGYMSNNYNDTDLIVNQNFINNTPNNLYNWDKICIFHHHNIIKKSEYDKVYERVKIFKNIYKERKNDMCLFYLTQIVETRDFEMYKKKIYDLKTKYNINCYIIIIVCSDKFNDTYSFENNILYIVKKVKDYNYQYHHEHGTDNNLDFTKEFNTIKKIFNLELMSYNDIKSKFSTFLI